MNDWWDYLQHSAKGSHWKDHKYVKIIDGVYYYPESYKGGKYALPDGKSGESDSGSKKTSIKGWRKKAIADINAELEKGTWSKEQMLSWLGERSDDVKIETIKNTLGNIGVDVDTIKDMSDEELLKMAKSLYNYYKKSSGSKSEKETNTTSLSEEDLNHLANEVIRGNYGNGQERKEKLGEHYQEIQARVNQMLRSQKSSGSYKKSVSTSTSKSNETVAKKKDKYRYSTKTKNKVTPSGKKMTVVTRTRQKVNHSDLYYNQNMLVHYGMPRRSGRYPWGSGADPFQRIRRGNSEMAAEQKKKAFERDERRKRINDSKYRHTLSDAELTTKINRLRKEKELRQLTNEEIHEGQQFVKGLMTDVAKNTLRVAGSGAAIYLAKSFITKKFDKYEFAESIFNGGAKKKK